MSFVGSSLHTKLFSGLPLQCSPVVSWREVAHCSPVPVQEKVKREQRLKEEKERKAIENSVKQAETQRKAGEKAAERAEQRKRKQENTSQQVIGPAETPAACHES